MNKLDNNFFNMIKHLLYALLIIMSVMTLINQNNLLYMDIAVIVTSTFEIFSEFFLRTKHLVKIIINLILLIMALLIYINI